MMRRILSQTFGSWSRQHMATHAAALAFYTLFALAPVVLATVFAAGRFLGEEFVRRETLTIVGDYIGPATARTLQNVLADWQPPELRLGAGLLTLAAMLLAATAFFVQLHESLNVIWRVERKRSILARTLYYRLTSFVMVIGSGLVLVLLFAFHAALAGFHSLVQDRLDMPLRLIGMINFLASLFIVAVLLTALFRFLPDARVRWSDAVVGGLATALLFEAGKWLIARYLRVANLASIYGAAGSLVVTLLWVYYVSLIILLGAEFTYAWGNREAGRHRGSGR